ncbi:uncharacterized protein H6S33_012846 [Morchella sextelata]|uniref:uncharacterized protein n=1 Tax=Morchella sextelata TaxID=1174677 RepID=UPI001D05A4F1|nr:uncharacterized protein H6S33_012846 [Morchella sextelata]KAH0609360.1 hypothetical protein H6S33_012846 [Morchella sextelata]
MSQQLCRYYQNGSCHFGSNCQFVHPGETRLPASSSASSFGNNTFGATRQIGYGNNNTSGGTQSKLGEGFNLPTQDSIKTDLTERPTWPLSSYAPGKDPPSQLIDAKDISPEEARVLAYKCRADGNPGAYEVEWQRLTLEADVQIKNILNDLPGAVNFMKKAYENRASSRYSSNNVPSSTFGTTASQTSPFVNSGQTASTFGQPVQPTSAFGQPSQPISPFGQPSQSISTYGQTSQPVSAFGQPPQPISAFVQPSQPTSSFGQAPQSTSAFGSPSPFSARPTPAFGQSAFGQPSLPLTPAFGQPAFGSVVPSVPQPQNVFGQPAFGQPALPKPAFGQPAFGQPTFGQPVALGQSSSFGAQPSATQASAFGQSTTQQPISAFGQPSPFGAGSAAKPAFGQPAFGQPAIPQSSPFGASNAAPQGQLQNPSPFGQPPQTNPVNTPFSQQASNSNIGTTASAFQQTSASPFSSVNPFQGQQATTEQAQSTSAFGQPQHQVPAFGQPITHVSTFGTPVQQNSSSSNNLNPFQTAQQQIQPISHQVNPQLREAQKTKKWDDPIIDYLRVEIEAFAAPTFTLGSVPTVAPSRDMCWA